MMTTWLRANRGFVLFLIGFGFFRTALADWNPVPSGSMRPTILEGDVVWVSRVAYDLRLPFSTTALWQRGDPQRGDVVTFSSPRDGSRLIKRVVGLPGDEVALRGQVLFINGQAQALEAQHSVAEPVAPGLLLAARRGQERLGSRPHAVQYLRDPAQAPDFGPLRVPPGEYFVMGDSRDNSVDSRVFGTVPRQRLIGQATRVLVSLDLPGHWLPRWKRFGQPL